MDSTLIVRLSNFARGSQRSFYHSARAGQSLFVSGAGEVVAGTFALARGRFDDTWARKCQT